MELDKKRKADNDGKRRTKTAKLCDDRKQGAEASQAGTICEGEDISARDTPEAPFPPPFASCDGPLTRAKSKAWNVYKLNRDKSSLAVRRLYDRYKRADIDELISTIHTEGFCEAKKKEARSSGNRDRVMLLLDVDSSSSHSFNIRYPKYGDLLDAIDKENTSVGVIKIERGTRGIGPEAETLWFLHVLRPNIDITVNNVRFNFAGSSRLGPLPDFTVLEYRDQAQFIFTSLAGLRSSPQHVESFDPLLFGTEILPYDPLLIPKEKTKECTIESELLPLGLNSQAHITSVREPANVAQEKHIQSEQVVTQAELDQKEQPTLDQIWQTQADTDQTEEERMQKGLFQIEGRKNAVLTMAQNKLGKLVDEERHEKEQEETAIEAAKKVEAAMNRAEAVGKQAEVAGQITTQAAEDQQSNLKAATPAPAEIQGRGEAAAKEVDEEAAPGLTSFGTEWNSSTGQAKAATEIEEGRSRAEEAEKQEETDTLDGRTASSKAGQAENETAHEEAQKQAYVERSAREADATERAAKTAYEEVKHLLNTLARHTTAREDEKTSVIMIEKGSDIQEDGPREIKPVETRDQVAQQPQPGQWTNSQHITATTTKGPESPVSPAAPIQDTSTRDGRSQQEVSTDAKSSTYPAMESCDFRIDLPKPAMMPGSDNRISRYSGQNKEAVLRDTRETLAGIPGLGLLIPVATPNHDHTDLNKDDAETRSLFEE